MSAQPSKYISGVSGLAKYLNCSATVANRLLERGLPRFRLADNKFHFRVDEVDEFVDRECREFIEQDKTDDSWAKNLMRG